MTDDLTPQAVARAVSAHLPGRAVLAVRDRGEWVRRIFELTLDRDETVLLKLSTHDDWIDGSAHEQAVIRLLRGHDLPTPRVLAVDATRALLPYPFIIEERQACGIRLGELLSQVSEADALAIYRALGDFYRRLHAIHGDRSGVWVDDPSRTFDISPNDYMFQAEIVEGSGRRALEAGRISARAYSRAVSLWREHLGALKAHQPALVHGSPFLWTIYPERTDDGWRIARITALGDILWWDAAYDLAFLLYPPFGSCDPARREAFLSIYGEAPNETRMLLYLVMQRLCAAMGVYLEPRTPQTRAWADCCLDDLDAILDRIEGVSGAFAGG